MKTERHSILSAVYLLLIDNNNVLLLERANTGWMDGNYSLPAGHLDGNETIAQATLREAFEEIGVTIEEKNLAVVHTMHRLADKEYIDFFLTTKIWDGVPINKEPHKCSNLQWVPLDSLPTNIVPHVNQALKNITENISFSESQQ